MWDLAVPVAIAVIAILVIGLMIAKRLVEIYRGTLSIDSVPGQATTVCLDLRIAADDQESP